MIGEKFRGAAAIREIDSDFNEAVREEPYSRGDPCPGSTIRRNSIRTRGDRTVDKSRRRLRVKRNSERLPVAPRRKEIANAG